LDTWSTMEINKDSKSQSKTVTKNQNFDTNGFIFLPGFVDVSNLIGQCQIETFRDDDQVKSSLTRYRYNDKNFENTFELCKQKIEKIIGCQLYKTYFFDRIYYAYNELIKHKDRESCEISLSVHISSNPQNIEWPFFIHSAKNKACSIVMQPGDAVLYKGHNHSHWREPLNPDKLIINEKSENIMYHQIFFHYVLANGKWAHYANDFVN